MKRLIAKYVGDAKGLLMQSREVLGIKTLEVNCDCNKIQLPSFSEYPWHEDENFIEGIDECDCSKCHENN